MTSKRSFKSALAISVMVVVLCAAVIAGATFALYSAQDTHNVTVNAGKISVTATATLDKQWSTNEETGEQTSSVTGSKVTVDGTNITFDNIALGDGADFTLALSMSYTINMKYSVLLTLDGASSDGFLRDNLVLTVNGEQFDLKAGSAYVVVWTNAYVADGTSLGRQVKFSLSLPWSAKAQDGDYTGSSVTFKLTTRAVQINAFTGSIATSDGSTYTDLAAAVANAAQTDVISLGYEMPVAEWSQEAAAAAQNKRLEIVGAGEGETTLNASAALPAGVTLRNLTVGGELNAAGGVRLEDVTVSGAAKITSVQSAALARTGARTESTTVLDNVTFKSGVTLTNAETVMSGCTGLNVYVGGGRLELADCAFASAGTFALDLHNAQLTINGGSYSATNSDTLNMMNSTGEINDGVFEVHGGANRAYPNIVSLGTYAAGGVAEGGSSHLTVNGGTFNSPDAYAFAVFASSILDYKGGDTTAKYFCVAGNGTNAGTITVNISGGSLCTTSGEDAAIYAPSAIDLNITGGTVSGASVLDIRMGGANVSVEGNAKLISTYETVKSFTYKQSSGASVSDGSMFILNTNRYKNRGTGDAGEITFTLGETVDVTAASGRVVNVYNWNQFDTEQTCSFDFGAFDGDAAAIGYYDYAVEEGQPEGNRSEGTLNANGVIESAQNGKYNAASFNTIAAALAAGVTDMQLIASNQSAETFAVESGSVTINVWDGVVYQACATISEGASLNVTGNGSGIIRGSGDHTLVNNGALTVGQGVTVDNISHGKAAVINNVGGTFTLDGGTLTRSQEAGNAENNGGNSFYVLQNFGTALINDGRIRANGNFSSLMENGWYDGTQNTTQTPSVMTINGGTFTGGLNTVKNDDWGEMTIAGGVFENYSQHCVLNWNVLNITGGSFTSDTDHVLYNGYLNDTSDKGMLTISGGHFLSGGLYNYNGGSIEVTGGVFGTFDLSAFLAPGYTATAGDNGYTVSIAL